MQLFTWRTRRLIESAVEQLGDERQRQIWLSWSRDNSQLRHPGGSVDDDGGAPPREVLFVMLSALEHLEASKRQRLGTPNLSEDEISDLENDLTYISGLSRDLRQMPAR